MFSRASWGRIDIDMVLQHGDPVTSVPSAVPPRDVAEELYQPGMWLTQLFGGTSEHRMW